MEADIDFINSLRDDDMAYLMGMHTKELHKLCGRLREDRFLATWVSPTSPLFSVSESLT